MYFTDAEQLVCELGLTEHAALSAPRVRLIAHGLPEELVVAFREIWTGSPKPISETWVPVLGTFGGVETIDTIATRLRQPVKQVRAALNTRLLLAAKRGSRGGDQFDLAVQVYRTALTQSVVETARIHMVLRQEVALYVRRLARAVADLGCASLDDAMVGGAERLKTHFRSHHAVDYRLFDRPWTPSPSVISSLLPEWMQ